MRQPGCRPQLTGSIVQQQLSAFSLDLRGAGFYWLGGGVRQAVKTGAGWLVSLCHRARLGSGFGELRNEPNLRARLLIRWGLCGGGNLGCGRLRLLRGAFCGLLGGLQALEFLESAMVVAADRIDAALETIEHLVAVVEDPADGMLIRVVTALRALGFVLPELRLGPVEPAEQPLGADQGIDEQAAFGGGAGEALLVFGDEGFELARIFAGNDVGFGVNAGFQGIETGRGLALGGARAGGFLGVLTIRLVLFVCSHDFLLA